MLRPGRCLANRPDLSFVAPLDSNGGKKGLDIAQKEQCAFDETPVNNAGRGRSNLAKLEQSGEAVTSPLDTLDNE